MRNMRKMRKMRNMRRILLREVRLPWERVFCRQAWTGEWTLITGCDLKPTWLILDTLTHCLCSSNHYLHHNCWVLLWGMYVSNEKFHWPDIIFLIIWFLYLSSSSKLPLQENLVHQIQGLVLNWHICIIIILSSQLSSQGQWVLLWGWRMRCRWAFTGCCQSPVSWGLFPARQPIIYLAIPCIPQNVRSFVLVLWYSQWRVLLCYNRRWLGLASMWPRYSCSDHLYLVNGLTVKNSAKYSAFVSNFDGNCIVYWIAVHSSELQQKIEHSAVVLKVVRALFSALQLYDLVTYETL